MIIKSLDTETTGLDVRHGASVFLVTMTDNRKPHSPYFWEWKVSPETRAVHIPVADLKEIQAELDEADLIIMQNGKFDIPFLKKVFKKAGLTFRWGWSKLRDTIIAGHLLCSNEPHDLTFMTHKYTGVNIQPLELMMKESVKSARNYVRSHLKDWRIAKEGMEDMPSAKEETWKYDLWLPRELARKLKRPEDHPDWKVTRNYGCADSEVLLPLWEKQEEELKSRGLWEIFLARMEVVPVVESMEDFGVTLNEERRDKLEVEYIDESARLGRVCTNIAANMGYKLTLPKGGSNGSLEKFAFEVLKLPVVMVTAKKKKPSLNKHAIDQYRATLPENSKQLLFVNNLSNKRKRDTALTFLRSYKNFWVPVFITNHKTGAGWYRLHPSLNITGTDTLRFSSENPNEQNISKKEGFNLRYCFGPAPGREWWSCDAKNIELRLPAYESGETEMINLFERPKDPPYFGSYHLLVFDILHPKLFAKYGAEVKDLFESTWYQWVKNGNFAVQYGALVTSGTADRAYHVPGAQARIMDRFGNIAKLNEKMIAIANEYGYVETMPDKTVNAKHGYPLQCTRTWRGEIKPTVPLNYHVQGTAMWWMMKAMVRCHNYLSRMDGFHLIMQIHDELVFDFPKGTGKEPWQTNLPVMRNVQKLMSMGGDDIGVPTPVSCKYHADNYSVGIAV